MAPEYTRKFALNKRANFVLKEPYSKSDSNTVTYIIFGNMEYGVKGKPYTTAKIHSAKNSKSDQHGSWVSSRELRKFEEKYTEQY